MLAYLGFYLGEKWDVLEVWFRRLDWMIVAAVVVLVVWWIWKHKHQKLKI